MILKFFRRKSEPDVQLEQGLEKTRRGVFLEITCTPREDLPVPGSASGRDTLDFVVVAFRWQNRGNIYALFTVDKYPPWEWR